MSAILNAVYNNYLTAYTPKPVTRYDTHKKSELRGICSAIVKQNKEAPWYLPTTNPSTQQYAVDLKENARGLRNTVAGLGGMDAEALLSKKSAYSSNEDIVSVSYIGPEKANSEIADMELEIQTLASPQENLGLFLADEKTSLAPDTYSFDVNINDMNYEFQFSIGESETNRSVQERLVRLINNSDIGIKASLAESEGRSALRLTSDATGQSLGHRQIFSISDEHTSKASGTVAYFGLDYMSHEPTNASFLVNGEARSASSNHFTIGKTFDVRLKSVTEEGQSVKIGFKTDMESLADNISNLIGGYNDFLKAASSYLETQARSRRLVQEFKGIASTYSSSLESAGVTISEDGTLAVDKDMLQRTAIQSNDINETFGFFKKFSGMLIRKSDQVSLNPMNYVDKTIVAYKNPGRNFVSPYTTSAYSGMMFNGYC